MYGVREGVVLVLQETRANMNVKQSYTHADTSIASLHTRLGARPRTSNHDNAKAQAIA
mgnify:FL=1